MHQQSYHSCIGGYSSQNKKSHVLPRDGTSAESIHLPDTHNINYLLLFVGSYANDGNLQKAPIWNANWGDHLASIIYVDNDQRGNARATTNGTDLDELCVAIKWVLFRTLKERDECAPS